MSLNAAYKGYMYQDIVTAYFFAEGLARSIDKIVVDSKQYPGDYFDDLTVIKDGYIIRRQFKYSSSIERSLEDKDLTTSRSSLRIDDITHCYKYAKEFAHTNNQ